MVDAHYARMRRLSATAMLAARKAWQRINPDRILSDWEKAAERLLPAFTNLQLLAATAGAEYGADTLRAQRIRTAPDAIVLATGFVGVASDGRPLLSLLQTPLDVVRDAVQREVPVVDAYERGRESLERIAHTQIGDAARGAAGVDLATRANVGWVRMINPPTCSRCLILAGRFYRWSDGFDRHPHDDCVHVATSQAAARREGLVDHPQEFFRSVSREEQDRMFGKAGAQAVRDGADMGQVVNARRGMQVAAPFGREVLATTVNARPGRLRLMPEQIYREATSRTDALRLLKLHGFIR